MSKQMEFYKKHYGQLVGKKIEGIAVDISWDETDRPLLGLIVTGGSIAWIQCDEEGNGPGFLSIEPAESAVASSMIREVK